MAPSPPRKLQETVTGLKEFQVPQLRIPVASGITALSRAHEKNYRIEGVTEADAQKIAPDIPDFKWTFSGFVDVYSNVLGTYKRDNSEWVDRDFSRKDFALVDLRDPFIPYMVCNRSVVRLSSREVSQMRTSVLYIGEKAAEHGKELKRFFENKKFAKRYNWEYRVCYGAEDRAKVAHALTNGRTDEITMISGVYGCIQDLFWKYLSVMCKDLLKKKDWKMVEAYKSDKRAHKSDN